MLSRLKNFRNVAITTLQDFFPVIYFIVSRESSTAFSVPGLDKGYCPPCVDMGVKPPNQKKGIFIMKDFTILTKQDAVRAMDSARYNPATDCGYFGRITENQCARPKSRKKCVSSAGKADVHIKYNGRYIPAEVKTNGGRVDSLIDGTNKSKFVIYVMNHSIFHKAGKKTPEWWECRMVGPLIIPTEVFLNCLQEVNAIKTINKHGVYDGLGIQVSSLKLYQRLLQWPVEFDRTRDYTSADFEGLTL